MIGELFNRVKVLSTKSKKRCAAPHVATPSLVGYITIESSKQRLSTRHSRFFHLLDRIDVEAASFVGTNDRILPRSSSGKLLIKSLENVFILTYPYLQNRKTRKTKPEGDEEEPKSLRTKKLILLRWDPRETERERESPNLLLLFYINLPKFTKV